MKKTCTTLTRLMTSVDVPGITNNFHKQQCLSFIFVEILTPHESENSGQRIEIEETHRRKRCFPSSGQISRSVPERREIFVRNRCTVVQSMYSGSGQNSRTTNIPIQKVFSKDSRTPFKTVNSHQIQRKENFPRKDDQTFEQNSKNAQLKTAHLIPKDGVTEDTSKSFNDLPHEMQLKIFSLLSVEDLALTIPFVCRLWHNIVLDSYLWQNIEYRPTSRIAAPIIKILESTPRLQSFHLSEHFNHCEFWKISEILTENCPMIKRLTLIVDRENYLDIDKLLENSKSTIIELTLIFQNSSYEPDVSKVDSTVLKAVGKCRNLRSLSIIGDIFYHHEVLKSIARGCKNLKMLNIQNCKSFTQTRLNSLLDREEDTITSFELLLVRGTGTLPIVAKHCHNLIKLSVMKPIPSINQEMTSADLDALQTMSTLEDLSIPLLEGGHCDRLTRIFKTKVFKNLKKLDISQSSDLRDRLLSTICEYCPKLVHLNIKHCPKISDEGFEKIHLLTNLKYLNVEGCTNLTDIGIERLLKCKNLSYLNISLIPGISDINSRKCELLNRGILETQHL